MLIHSRAFAKFFDKFLHIFHILPIGLYLLQRPVPPFDFIQSIYYLWGKPIADDFGRIATYNGIGRYIFGDDSISANNGSITDFYTFDNGGIATDPYVMPND